MYFEQRDWFSFVCKWCPLLEFLLSEWQNKIQLLDCVLKASAVNCWSIYPVDPRSTLHQHLGWHLTKTRSALNQHFDRHSINSWSIVGRESTNSCVHVLINTCSMEHLEKLVLRLSTDCWLTDCMIVWDVDGVSIKGWWRIPIGTWPWVPAKRHLHGHLRSKVFSIGENYMDCLASYLIC